MKSILTILVFTLITPLHAKERIPLAAIEPTNLKIEFLKDFPERCRSRCYVSDGKIYFSERKVKAKSYCTFDYHLSDEAPYQGERIGVRSIEGKETVFNIKRRTKRRWITAIDLSNDHTNVRYTGQIICKRQGKYEFSVQEFNQTFRNLIRLRNLKLVDFDNSRKNTPSTLKPGSSVNFHTAAQSTRRVGRTEYIVFRNGKIIEPWNGSGPYCYTLGNEHYIHKGMNLKIHKLSYLYRNSRDKSGKGIASRAYYTFTLNDHKDSGVRAFRCLLDNEYSRPTFSHMRQAVGNLISIDRN